MHIKPIITVFLGIIFVLVFSGCSYLTDFYIQNLTATKKIIKINYNYPISKAIANDPGSFEFNYENEVLTPRSFQKIKSLKSLEKKVVGDSAIVLEIYPNSTTRIDKSHNGNWRDKIKSVEMDGKVFTPAELKNKTKFISNDYILKIK
ncbi:hypothetical protein [Chryseobacterium sp. BIGb0232]|uniref:hypothetical protein n=1 Tax=Chryseobacterium sp. BIGb0232 TaxID=2940598 RepID=UPI000F92AC61|nr:hypothetical protein [Chryseobacterium sp. BIGb0232]MCS4301927.1 hypothetical protein [Chryseobacterium sp. BIGb0232]ROS17873.1 hypothetical protein EDF65_2260 [Chryseobacterium nakagawai]